LWRRSYPEQEADAGFTLIEAVIALALVSILLAAIGAVVASNSRGASKLEQHVALIQATRLVSATIPRAGEMPPGDSAGEIAGYRWQTRITPFDELPAIAGAMFVPQRVQLRVRSPSGVVQSLETIRLIRKDGS
jgi:general secretion pathway protein I